MTNNTGRTHYNPAHALAVQDARASVVKKARAETAAEYALSDAVEECRAIWPQSDQSLLLRRLDAEALLHCSRTERAAAVRALDAAERGEL